MPFEYKCQSCQAIGDLDSFVNQIECPNCGGIMLPATAPSPQAPPPPPPPSPEKIAAVADTPTTIVPRSEILKETSPSAEQPKKVVKVAKIVNIGFGGMLTTSATRGFKPITPGRKDAGFPFSPHSSFPQEAQKQIPVPGREAMQEHDEQSATSKKNVTSSSNNLSGQRKKTYTVSKTKPLSTHMQQTSTQHMDATQVDPRIAEAGQQVQTNEQKSLQQDLRTGNYEIENNRPQREFLPKTRLSTQTATSLKFLPKGALKVAQTHTAIQNSLFQPRKTQSQTQSPVQPLQQMPPGFSDHDKDFTEQVRIEAERQEAIIREAYRIAEEKIRKEKEELEIKAAEEKVKKEAGKPELSAKETAEMLLAQIAKELAETEELIKKERETLELRKKELQEIKQNSEEEAAKASQNRKNKLLQETDKAGGNDITPAESSEIPSSDIHEDNARKQETGKRLIIPPPQKPVKLKSTEGSEILMRSSKNLKIDKNMLETGKLALHKDELEKKDFKTEGLPEMKKDDTAVKKTTSKGFPPPPIKKGAQTPLFASAPATYKPPLADKIGSESAVKEKNSPFDIGKTQTSETKLGISTNPITTGSPLEKVRRNKKTVIYFIAGLTVAVICLLIFLFGGNLLKTIKSSFSSSPLPIQSTIPSAAQSGKKTGSSLQMEYDTVYQKIKKAPSNKQEIDANIKEWQDFIDRHPTATDSEKCIKDAKIHIKNMQDLKELY